MNEGFIANLSDKLIKLSDRMEVLEKLNTETYLYS